MKAKLKYVVGHKGDHQCVYGKEMTGTDRITYAEAVHEITHEMCLVNRNIVEIYELVPVDAWKCVVGKDGTRRMVKVKAKSLTGDGKGGAA